MQRVIIAVLLVCTTLVFGSDQDASKVLNIKKLVSMAIVAQNDKGDVVGPVSMDMLTLQLYTGQPLLVTCASRDMILFFTASNKQQFVSPVLMLAHITKWKFQYECRDHKGRIQSLSSPWYNADQRVLLTIEDFFNRDMYRPHVIHNLTSIIWQVQDDKGNVSPQLGIGDFAWQELHKYIGSEFRVCLSRVREDDYRGDQTILFRLGSGFIGNPIMHFSNVATWQIQYQYKDVMGKLQNVTTPWYSWDQEIALSIKSFSK